MRVSVAVAADSRISAEKGWASGFGHFDLGRDRLLRKPVLQRLSQGLPRRTRRLVPVPAKKIAGPESVRDGFRLAQCGRPGRGSTHLRRLMGPLWRHHQPVPTRGVLEFIQARKSFVRLKR